MGYLNIQKIKNYVKTVFRNKIKFNGNIMKYVNVEIIKLQNSIQNIKKQNITLTKYYQMLSIYNNKKKKYISNKLTWYKLLNRYNAKLCELVNSNDTRIELINYIEKYDIKSPIIKLLKSNFLLEHHDMEYVNKHKNNKNNIYYWLTIWKDQMLKFVKSIKPKFNFKIPSECYPIHILLTVKNMIPYWLNNNNNINLYLIKFTFKAQQKLNIKYKNIYNEWSLCKRTVLNDNPCCISYDEFK